MISQNFGMLVPFLWYTLLVYIISTVMKEEQVLLLIKEEHVLLSDRPSYHD